ncbi:MAG: gliding motility lipoprotein GldJ [Paludibacter sp.]|nr:MAG: gliding motility lipoprotein GldJ [Paludibacter sp.]
MKQNRIISLLLGVGVVLTFIQCTPQKSSKPKRGSTTSTATGWVFQNEQFTGNNGYASAGFVAQENYKPQIPAGMVLIEGGTFVMGEKTNMITAEYNNSRRRVSVASFYMDKYEVSNLNWREYTHWMELVFGKVAPELVAKTQPKINKSEDPLSYNDPYFDRYYTHPAFNNYPVIGVSWEQAMDYCQWRTDRLNELMLVKAGVLAEPNFAYVQRQTELDSITHNFVFNTEKYLLDRSYQPKPGSKPLRNAYGEVRKATMGDGLMFPNFRLPTEAEWEFAAYGLKANRNGVVEEGRMYPWSGNEVRSSKKGKQEGRMQANYMRGRGDMMGTAGALNDKYATTAPVNAYPPNDFGLYNMAGNVNEWVLDVYRPTSHKDVAEYNPFRGNSIFTYLTNKEKKSHFKIDSLGRIAYTVKENISSYKDGHNSIKTDFQLYTDPDGKRNLRNRRYLEQDKATNDIGFRCVMTMLGSIDNQGKKSN